MGNGISVRSDADILITVKIKAWHAVKIKHKINVLVNALADIYWFTHELSVDSSAKLFAAMFFFPKKLKPVHVAKCVP